MNKTFNLYCDESTHLENDNMPYMIYGYVSIASNQIQLAKKQIKQIKLEHNFEGEMKWNNVCSKTFPFYSEIIVPAFPWIEESVAKMIRSFELRQSLKKIYNGQIIFEMTGLHGKELGSFMKNYGLSTSPWSDEEIQFWISHKENLMNLVARSFEDYQNEKS